MGRPFAPLLRQFARRLHYWKLRRAIDVRTERLLRPLGRTLWPRLAPAYRPLLSRTTFIAVTGSVGKTTTKELIAGILARRHPVQRTTQGGNQPVDIAHSILRTRRRHRFAVHEVGVGKRGDDGVIDRSMALIRPRIAVVTSIGDDHISAYGSREAIAEEKGKVVAALPRDGIAVLNADDPLVRGMAVRCKGRVVTYGRASDADVRAKNVRARWPDRLAFDVVYGNVSVAVQTQLCGEHWIGVVLAAIAATLAAGAELPEIATALAGIAPTPHRMFPVTRDGVTFVCDDAKAPLWTIPIALAFLADARAPRKILVVGRLSDYAEHRSAYVSVAKAARPIADHTLFFGQWAWNVERARAGAEDDRVQWFNAFESAKRRLSELLRPGDLVLLKGNEDDRMDRFLKDTPAPAADGQAAASAHEAQRNDSNDGLGNPGERHRGARHSVGHEVVERLAARNGLAWRDVGGAAVAQLARQGASVVLVKLDAQMNDSGPALQRLQQSIAIEPLRTILVHDEFKLDPGRIRGRLEGGDGGHLGARSVLSTFESHRFRRVKVGVGAPPPGRSLVDHVLGPFDENERAAIEGAIDAACDQALVFVDEILHDGRQAPAAVPASSPARAGG